MKIRVIALVALCLASAAARAASIPSPSEFLGLRVGADKTLADYRQILRYFKALDAASPRVELEILGKTTLGEDLFLAAISSEKNIANKKRLQEIARRIADPRGLSAAEADALVHEGKVILLITCNIHATEIGASQMALEWAYALATAEDAETKRRLDEVVLLLLPSINPDGQIMESEWYRKNLGTRYEGGRQPWLYHHYVGHDNNRDWFMLTQKETQAVTRAVYHEWFPQVWLDEHQMGLTRAAHLRAALRRAGRPGHPPARVARREPDRREHGAAARAAEEERCDLRLPVRRLLAGRHQEHRLVEEHRGTADRGRLGPARDAGAHRAGRALGRQQGPRRVRARRRTSRTPGRAACGGCATSWTTSGSPPTRSSRAAPTAAPTSCRTRSRARATWSQASVPRTPSAFPPRSVTPPEPLGSRPSWPSTGSSCARRRTATSTFHSRSPTAASRSRC